MYCGPGKHTSIHFTGKQIMKANGMSGRIFMNNTAERVVSGF
jgi:hypothetical protein